MWEGGCAAIITNLLLLSHCLSLLSLLISTPQAACGGWRLVVVAAIIQGGDGPWTHTSCGGVVKNIYDIEARAAWPPDRSMEIIVEVV